LHTADGDVKDYSHMENSSEVPQNRTTIWSSHPTTRHISKENEIIIPKRHLHCHVSWALFTTAKKWE
jgi:hypothetical protein